jgi:hypothetical protein
MSRAQSVSQRSFFTWSHFSPSAHPTKAANAIAGGRAEIAMVLLVGVHVGWSARRVRRAPPKAAQPVFRSERLAPSLIGIVTAGGLAALASSG